MNNPLAKCSVDHSQIIMTVFVHTSSDGTSTALHFDVAMHITAVTSQLGPGPGGFNHRRDPISIFGVHKEDFKMRIIVRFNLAEAPTDQAQLLTRFNA